MGEAHRMDVDINRITISKGWFDNRDYIKQFNEQLRKIDKHLYCSFDIDEGLYKVYQKLPVAIWGIGGDWDGEGYEILKVTIPNTTTPCKPTTYHLKLLKSWEVKKPSWKVANQSNFKFQNC